jgi:PrtD family type I secretion system ABC transporter
MLIKLAVSYEARLSSIALAGELAAGGEAQRQTLSYISNIRQVLSSNVYPSLFDLPVTIIFLALVYLIHPVMGAIVTCGLCVLGVFAVLGEVLTHKLARETQQNSTAISRRVDQIFRQQELIKALGLFRESTHDVSRFQSRYLSSLLKSSQRTNGFGAASRTIRQILQIALIGGGAALVLDNQVTAGVIFASSIVASRALAPVEAIIAGWGSLKMASLNTKLLEARLRSLSLSEDKTPLPKPEGRLMIDGVVFAPPMQNAKPILKGITGAIEPGSMVAVIGPSGSGKSTLARCLIGYLKPSRGRVTLDGQDLDAWDPVTRGTYMRYLPQSIEFFEATVRENIACLRRDHPQFAIDAAKFAGIHDMIMGFPDGYDTMISPNGFMPSGGQKQLLGMARAFYGHPSAVVLDEPNASLDGEGEKILQETLRRAKRYGITVVVVTQRLSLLRIVDKVLLLKNGAVERFGTPGEVMQAENVRAFPSKAQPALGEERRIQAIPQQEAGGH